MLAIVGLFAVFALILVTAQRQRLARLERRLSHLENEAGVNEDEHQAGKMEKPHGETLRGRTRKLELSVKTLERRSLRPRRASGPKE